VEPIQGRGGDRPPPKGWLRALRQLCDQHGMLLIFDEVFTGFGRAGALFQVLKLKLFSISEWSVSVSPSLERRAELKGEPLARETASNTDVMILSWPHNASPAPWSSTPSLQRSIQAWQRVD